MAMDLTILDLDLAMDLVLDLVLRLVLELPRLVLRSPLKNLISKIYRFRGIFGCIR